MTEQLWTGPADDPRRYRVPLVDGRPVPLITAGNLIPRARDTHKWYQQQFADYPTDRNALVPFLW